MHLDQAIELLRNAVKNNSTNGDNHIDLTLVRADVRPQYEEALKVAQLAIHKGVITKDDFLHRIQVSN